MNMKQTIGVVLLTLAIFVSGLFIGANRAVVTPELTCGDVVQDIDGRKIRLVCE